MSSKLNQKVVEVNIATKSSFRPTEIVADLRNVAETLYHPLQLAGFWMKTPALNFVFIDMAL